MDLNTEETRETHNLYNIFYNVTLSIIMLLEYASYAYAGYASCDGTLRERSRIDYLSCTGSPSPIMVPIMVLRDNLTTLRFRNTRIYIHRIPSVFIGRRTQGRRNSCTHEYVYMGLGTRPSLVSITRPQYNNL